jgi:alpha-tubulin suppressor-like RCC1 family protein
LGLGDTQSRGDQPGEMGDNLPAVDLGTGRTAKSLAVGSNSSCAILDDGTAKCWGYGAYGELGLAGSRGDQPNEMGDALPALDLGTGRTATAMVSTPTQTCALLDDDSLKCWGWNLNGELGLGDTAARGDQPGTMGDNLPAVDVGTGRSVVALPQVAFATMCALLDDSTVKCWGYNQQGELGLGDMQPRGGQPGQMGDALPALDFGLGHRVHALTVGGTFSCVLLEDRTVKCWGGNTEGQLGLGDQQNRGDKPGEMGDKLPTVDVGF